MVASINNIKDNSLENKLRLEMVIKTMLSGMAMGNRDGTGIAFSTEDNKVFMTKTVKNGHEVAQIFEVDTDLDYKHFILHTRTATMGPPSNENSHPHETKYGYLIQNGWQPELYRKLKEHMKTGCDTEALAHVFDPNPEIFEKNLLGNEHFAIIHLSNDGSLVHVMNKNKFLYRAYSKVLSAELFLTSSGVLQDIGTLINENLIIKTVNDGEIHIMDGNILESTKFNFKDTGWSYGGEWWKSYYDTPSEPKALPSKKRPVYNNYLSAKERADIPNHVFRMTRKERRRWVRENQEKREAYIQFWMEQEAENEREKHQNEMTEEDGFIILDSDGYPIKKD